MKMKKIQDYLKIISLIALMIAVAAVTLMMIEG